MRKLTNEQLAEIRQRFIYAQEQDWPGSPISDSLDDIPALLDAIAELQAENKILETSFEECERNKNRYADEIERKENEDLINALEDAFGTLTDEEVEGYVKTIRQMGAISNDRN
ncbi:hypothetical protein [Cytobacillus purgationiresistens]|uniref:Uncharacterized protein n=1 Tax=Cytobacillus purgationiresistens TaxID=863449 RepID=A0ABU0AK71_9BACI|nr:hypothetical protein [Cytobacillus purgationiresistens]MDQ0270798.1 hypothetical protein [Cytobacillus purgationiresistens]